MFTVDQTYFFKNIILYGFIFVNQNKMLTTYCKITSFRDIDICTKTEAFAGRSYIPVSDAELTSEISSNLLPGSVLYCSSVGSDAKVDLDDNTNS